jgi:hypothetical protein
MFLLSARRTHDASDQSEIVERSSVSRRQKHDAGASRSAGTHAAKACVVCGRAIAWRKKWERDWEQVLYCSALCRRRGLGDRDERLERAILGLLAARGLGATICPSEAARAIEPDAWRDLMEPARSAARRLVNRGLAEITQGGRVVDPSTAKGAVRICLTRR